MPDLSVVVSSLNGAPGVDRALCSLGRQTIADRVEAVVVDDGSSDGTVDVGREHGALAVRPETNRGLAEAGNSGVRAPPAFARPPPRSSVSSPTTSRPSRTGRSGSWPRTATASWA